MSEPHLARATIIASVDDPAEVAGVEAWFARWRPHLTYCSDDTGCGCCIQIWDVEGPPEAIAEVPESVSALSEWSKPELWARTELAPEPDPASESSAFPRATRSSAPADERPRRLRTPRKKYLHRKPGQ